MGVNLSGAKIVNIPNDGSTARLFADVSTPPSRPVDTAQSQPPKQDDGYLRDLWGMTGKAANLESHTEHPDFRGASAGNVHSHAKLTGGEGLTGNEAWNAQRNDAARRNEEARKAFEESGLPPGDFIKPYHENRPIVSYRTDMHTDEISRVHGEDNKISRWATRRQDIQDATGQYVSGEEAQQRLNTPNTPTDVSSVHPDIGTDIIASRPISGDARQYQLLQLAESWFGPSTKLG